MFLSSVGGKKMDINKRIGMLLKEKREASGLSLSQVGSIMKKNKSTIYYYETGRIHIDVYTLDKICKVYGTDMYSFIDELKR